MLKPTLGLEHGGQNSLSCSQSALVNHLQLINTHSETVVTSQFQSTCPAKLLSPEESMTIVVANKFKCSHTRDYVASQPLSLLETMSVSMVSTNIDRHSHTKLLRDQIASLHLSIKFHTSQSHIDCATCPCSVVTASRVNIAIRSC